MLRSKIQITGLCAIGLIANMHADQKVIKGQTYQVPKNKATQIPGLFKKHELRAPACPSPLPIIPFFVNPLPNPTPLPGAFFPTNPLAQNQLVPPPQTIGLSFIASKQGNDPSNTPVPDSYGVKGLAQYILSSNSGVVTFNSDGVRDNILDNQSESMLNFDGDYTIFMANRDARIHYDSLANRFLIINLVADVFITQFGYNGFSIAVSDSGVITEDTKWTVFTIFDNTIIPDSNGCPGNVVNPASNGNLYDYPCIGIDKDAIYVAFTAATIQGGGPSGGLAWVSNSLYVIQKESFYNDNGPVQITSFPDVTLTTDGNFVGDQGVYRIDSTLFPLDNFDLNSQFGYAICQDPVYFGKLRVYRIVNPGSISPSIVGPFILDVMQTYADASNPINFTPFQGQLYKILGLIEYPDDRLSDSSHVNKKQIYTAQAVFMDRFGNSSASGDRLGIRWYQLDVTGDPTGQGLGVETATTMPALVQAGTLFDTAVSNPLYYSFPAIMSNRQGDISLCGTVAGVNQPPSAFYVGKAGTDPKDGTLKIGAVPPNVYAIGVPPFTRSLGFAGSTFPAFEPFGQRWGDMSYSSLDPVDKKTIWTIQEICKDGCVTTAVAKLLAP